MNATLEKFGDPATRVASYDHWAVLLRPQQVTVGAMVLVCTDPVTRFSALSASAFADLQQAVTGIERTLAHTLRPDKINYLMLMMVDPQVHFHVLPRYAEAKTFQGTTFADPGWPAVPNLGAATETDEALNAAIIAEIKQVWPA